MAETTWRQQKIRQVLLAPTAFDACLSAVLTAMSAHFSRLLCSQSRSGRKSGLWDTTEAETTPRNAQNAGRRMSDSRARSSLRAILRLAMERRWANNALRTELLIRDGILLALLNQPRTTDRDNSICARAPSRRLDTTRFRRSWQTNRCYVPAFAFRP
jgi:hypothetical protein